MTPGRRARTRTLASIAAVTIVAGSALTAASAVNAAEADLEPPAFDVTITGTLQNGWYIDEPHFHVTASDPSGVATIYFTDGGGNESAAGSTAEFVLTLEGSSDVQVWAEDSLGNVSSLWTHNTSVDRSYPTISSTTGDGFVLDEAVPFAFECSDDESGIADCGADVANGGLLDTSTAGVHSVNMWAVNAAGLRTERAFEYLVSDVTGPNLELLVPRRSASGWLNQTADVEVRATDRSGVYSVAWEKSGAETGSDEVAGVSSVTFDVSTEGETEITYWAWDAAGNRSDYLTDTVRIDRTKPVVSLDLPVAPAPFAAAAPAKPTYDLGQVVPFEFVCADALSGIAACSADVLDGNVLPTSTAGPHVVTVTAFDRAGNSTLVPIEYEVRAPALPVTAPDGTVLASTGVGTTLPLVIVALLIGSGALMAAARRVARRGA